jgi:hypothetical protein
MYYLIGVKALMCCVARVAKPGVKTSRVVREKVYLATLMTILMTFRAYLLAPSAC